MEIRAIAPNEWKYTYSQSMQITGQTGNIGHLRGDFDSGGYGFYTTWNDHRPQWKTDEFKTELDEVINALRSPEYGLLQNRPAMSEYARRFPDSAFKGKEYYSSKEIEYFDDYTLQEVLEKSKIREEWDNKFDAVKNAKEQFLTLKIAKEITTE